MVSMTSPSLAQGENACREAFEQADTIRDGVITHTEIPKAKQLPPEFAKAGLVGRHEFMAACAKMALGKPAASSPKSPGISVSPETSGQKQPQGQTGPLETKEGGAPASSPQGQTPGGMQAAPDGSSKIIVEPDSKER
jgi:hypothetical protein